MTVEDAAKRNEEVVDDLDVSECVDEWGGLLLRKLILVLKQDYNFNVESILFFYLR